jgi:hypothetical protein
MEFSVALAKLGVILLGATAINFLASGTIGLSLADYKGFLTLSYSGVRFDLNLFTYAVIF